VYVEIVERPRIIHVSSDMLQVNLGHETPITQGWQDYGFLGLGFCGFLQKDSFGRTRSRSGFLGFWRFWGFGRLMSRGFSSPNTLLYTLQAVALTVFGMMTISAASERNFSTMRFVHIMLRNSLGKERVEKLVFIKTNAQSLESKTVSDWIEDEDEDGFDKSAVNSSVVDMIELE
jgi:hAT family C-terminal dimerisation region